MMNWPSNRYPRMTVSGKRVYVHRVVWEQAYGPIPPGMHVHHKDGDPHNNALGNLECISHGEHNRVHHAKPPKPCAEDDCSKVAHKRGYCDTHYVRFFRREKHNAQSREYQRKRRAAKRAAQQIAIQP